MGPVDCKRLVLEKQERGEMGNKGVASVEKQRRKRLSYTICNRIEPPRGVLPIFSGIKPPGAVITATGMVVKPTAHLGGVNVVSNL